MASSICQLKYDENDSLNNNITLENSAHTIMRSFTLSSLDAISALYIEQYNILYDPRTNQYVFIIRDEVIELYKSEYIFEMLKDDYGNLKYISINDNLSTDNLLSITHSIISITPYLSVIDTKEVIVIKAVIVKIYIINLNYKKDYKLEGNNILINVSNIIDWAKMCRDNFSLTKFEPNDTKLNARMYDNDMLICLYFFSVNILFTSFTRIKQPEINSILQNKNQTWESRLNKSCAFVIGACYGNITYDLYNWSKLDINYIGLGADDDSKKSNLQTDQTNKLLFKWDVDNINKNTSVINSLKNHFNFVVLDDGTWFHLFDKWPDIKENNGTTNQNIIIKFLTDIMITPLKSNGLLLISSRNVIPACISKFKNLSAPYNKQPLLEDNHAADIRHNKEIQLNTITNNFKLIGTIINYTEYPDTNHMFHVLNREKSFFVYIKKTDNIQNEEVRDNIRYLEQHLDNPINYY